MAVDFDILMSVFREALEEHPREQWDDFVQQAAGADEELCRQVRQLLHAHAHGHSLFDKPVVPSPTLDQPITEKPGTQIGPYRLLQQLGEGGMGVVYMAEQSPPVRRKVALKVIKPGMSTKDVVARFEAERQSLALMDHPNIARVIDGGATESGLPFFVMELVQGLPITQYCNERRLTTAQRLKVFVKVCQAVQHAHLKGIIHRDLKPSNVLVAEIDGQAIPKVIDFGVAKAVNQVLSDHPIYTQYSQLVGTPLYMSPEQAGLGVIDIDTRSDVYSLGVMLYELLTGSTPFDSETLKRSSLDEMRRIIREREPVRPSHQVSTLGAKALSTVAEHRGLDPRKIAVLLRGDLDWMVMKCLDKDRARRYESASALAADIERYLDGQAVHACPPSAVYRVRKLARRYRLAIVSAAAITMVLLAGLAGTSWQAFKATRAEARAREQVAETERERKLADQARTEEGIARTEAEQQRDLATDSLYLAHIRLAQRDWETGQTPRLFDTLEKHLPAAGRPDRRGWEWYYLLAGCYDNYRTIRDARGVWTVDWSPDGRRVAFGGICGIHLWDPLRGGQRTDLNAGSTSELAWSPSGKQLAAVVSVSGGIQVWDVADNGKATTRLEVWPPSFTKSPTALAWSPDGTMLAATGHGPDVDIWNVDTGEHLRTIPHEVHDDKSVDWHPNTSAAWHPNLPLLAIGGQYGAANFVVEIVDVSTGNVITTKHSPIYDVLALAWSPSGKQIAASFHGGAVSIWSFDGKQLGELHSFTGPNSADDLAWNSTGNYLAAATRGQRIIVWDANTGETHRTLQGHLGAVAAVDWGPDDRYLVSAGPLDGTVRVWDVHANTDSFTSRGPDARHHTLRWTPDGRILLEGDTGWQIVAPDGDNELAVELPFVNDSQWTVSPDTRAVAVSDLSDSTIESITVMNRHTSEKIFSFEIPYHAKQLTWSPDSKWLAVAYWRTHIGVWNTVTGEKSDMGDVPSDATSVSFSPDSAQLAVGGVDGRITLWSVNNWKQTGTLRGHQMWVGDIAWSWDGSKIAAGGIDGKARVWDVAGRRLISTLHGHTGTIKSLSWHPDGERIVTCSGDGTVRIWRVASEDELMVFLEGSETGTAAAFSPDGLKLASLPSGRLVVRDASAGYAAVEGGEFALDQASLRRDRGQNIASAGRYDEAQQHYREALEIRTRAVGPEHPSTLESAKDLAFAIIDMGRQAEGQKLLEETLKLQRRTLGNHHLRTLLTVQNLAYVYEQQNQFADAAQLRQELVQAGRHRSDNDPAKVTMFLDWLYVLAELGRSQEFYAASCNLLDVCRKSTRLGDWYTTYSLNQYFAACEAVGKHTEAKEVWEQMRSKANWESAPGELPAEASAEYRVRIDAPGDHQLFLRWGGQDGESDSVWTVVLDEQGDVLDWYLFQGADAGSDIGDTDADFATHSWETFAVRRCDKQKLVLEQPALVHVPAPGEYVIRLVRREPNAAVDALILQQAHLPPPQGDGAAESPRDESGAFVMHDGIVTIEAEHFSTAPPTWRIAPSDEEPQVRHKNFRGQGYLLIPD